MVEKRTIRIGDLLVGSEVLTESTMDSRAEVAKLLNQPLGQTLVQFGDVTNYQLLCAVQLQSLCLDEVMNLESAIQALRLVKTTECYLEDALEKVGFIDDTHSTAKLGELLLEAGQISELELNRALDLAFRNCTPLGQILLQHGLVAPVVIVKALSVQRKIRSGSLSRAEAITDLAAVSDTVEMPALDV